MNIKGLDIKLLREKLEKTQEEFGNLIGVSGRTIINYEKGLKIPESKTEILRKLWDQHMNIDLIQEAKEPQTPYISKSEVVQKDDSEFMEVTYLPRYAQAGYLDSIQDESIPDVETKLVPKEYEKGNYLIVEITGDSMDDGTKRSIMDGDSVLIKELSRVHWSNKLHFKQYLFVLMSREGVVCKQITAHNVNTGIITCHSWNELYKDYELDLRDVFKIFYVKKIIDRKIKF